ncbi:ATP-dependent DNA helicase Hel308 [Frankliniella fusca]|uniref:ATP-dependent DNA helicase Hel308 n=1 Tax=Frankliniella fusca TaxID=407009 RepID=A0AAE1HDZ6_9NEOP|nr:ATP-dependent DNA helicase Hel308 [Frankliniella fusca]
MIGEGKRGLVLEDLMTNILYCTRVVALSATVGNPDKLASFLGCGNPDNSFLYRVDRRTSTHVKKHVIVAGGAFPILREDGGAAGNVNFQSGRSDGHEVEMDFLHDISMLGEDPPLLWLRIHQLRLFIERATLVMFPHRLGSVQICFPNITRIPCNVLDL